MKDDGNVINIQQQQQINQLKTKQREHEKTISTLKHKEVFLYFSILHYILYIDIFYRWNMKKQF